MKKNKKMGTVASKTNLEFEAKVTQGHATFPKANSTRVSNKEEIINSECRFKEPLSHAARKAKPLLYQEFDIESLVGEIEIHWMAFAVYNQK